MRRPALLFMVGVGLALRAGSEAPARPGGSRQPVQDSACNDVPAHAFDLILGRPTTNAVTVSVLCYDAAEGSIAYGTQPGRLTAETPARHFRKGEPAEVVLAPLQPDTRYVYRLRTAQTNSGEFAFRTARAPGRGFTFTVTADSHLDQNTDPALYQRTLANARADTPDFHIDLGDTFMTGKHASREAAVRQYLAQRFYFGQLCGSAPLFLVLGNHDGEESKPSRSGETGLAAWSCAMRTRCFPNPVPDGFYTGDAAQCPEAGLLQDYYAWTWGDALFIVLDPFWFTPPARGRDDAWSRTLGDAQYRWLARTLEAGAAPFTFVFIHHLVGGADSHSRGGAEAAPFYEWGGRNADGSDGFAQHRPGWSAPIHALLVRHRVAAVFHGHDHFYAKQDLDGIVYQEVPQPGDPRGTTRNAAAYGYTNGLFLGSSGYLRVTVAAREAAVEYVRLDRTVAHRYTIPSSGLKGGDL